MKNILDQLRNDLDSLFFFYLNALHTSRKHHERFKSQFNETISTLGGISKEMVTRKNLLVNPMIAVKNYEKPPGEDLVHEIPLILAYEHSLPRGYHEGLLAASIITESYNLWEDKYRRLIADTVGLEKNEIKNDFWGEARFYRTSIVHHKKRAIKEIENCSILPNAKENTTLNLKYEFVIQFMNESIKSLDDLKETYSK